jgi:hypothetical protein
MPSLPLQFGLQPVKESGERNKDDETRSDYQADQV